MEEVMPSRRHSSATLSSPRKPSSRMRFLSSAEKWRRVARRMSLTTVSAGSFAGPDLCFIFAPYGSDEPEILRSREPSLCLMGPDAGQWPMRSGTGVRFMDVSQDYARLDATALADLVRRRHITPAELVDAAIARLERSEPTLAGIME